jgi:hypothetical protein
MPRSLSSLFPESDIVNLYVANIRKAAERLRGTHSGDALGAVLGACEQLHSHGGVLDQNNRRAAALALCSVLSERHLADTILDMAELVANA